MNRWWLTPSILIGIFMWSAATLLSWIVRRDFEHLMLKELPKFGSEMAKLAFAVTVAASVTGFQGHFGKALIAEPLGGLRWEVPLALGVAVLYLASYWLFVRVEGRNPLKGHISFPRWASNVFLSGLCGFLAIRLVGFLVLGWN